MPNLTVTNFSVFLDHTHIGVHTVVIVSQTRKTYMPMVTRMVELQPSAPLIHEPIILFS